MSTYIVFHYYDARFGVNVNSYDQAVMIRISNSSTLQLSGSDLSLCY